MTVHTVIFEGGAQTLRSYPYDDEGEPMVFSSGLTYGISDLRRSDTSNERAIVAAGTSGTIDTTSATTTAAAGVGTADKTKIEVDDVTGFEEGALYVLQYLGRREAFNLDRIDSTNDILYSRDPILAEYPTGTTVRGFYIEATFPSAQAADRPDFENGGGPYSLDWVYPSGSSVPGTRETVFVRRSHFRVYATVEDVRILDQQVANLSRKRYRIEDALKQAHRDVRRWLRNIGIDPANYYGSETLRDAITYRTCSILRGNLNDERDVELARSHQSTYESIMQTISPVDTVFVDPDNDVAPAGTTPVRTRRIRVT